MSAVIKWYLQFSDPTLCAPQPSFLDTYTEHVYLISNCTLCTPANTLRPLML